MRNRSLVLCGGLILVVAFAGGCRRDPCEVDNIEQSGAIDLGQFSDAETRMELPLTLHNEQDVDVFEFDIIDQGSDGNPQLYLWATGHAGEQLTLSVEFQCSSDIMENFTCDGFEDPSRPGFCSRTGSGEQHLHVTYDCVGGLIDDTDNGFAVVTVSREGASSGGICAAYDLEIFTD